MQESFLHYIWKNQLYNRNDLLTTQGESIQITHPGFYNLHAGPDFKESKLHIGQMQWSGSVEIHTKSSDWLLHGHTGDPNYDLVILHVVYEHDQEIENSDGEVIPTLELKGLIKPGILQRYESLMLQPAEILCGSQLSQVNPIIRLNMLERVVVERIQRKAEWVTQLLKDANNNWEETAFQCLASGLGFKTNAQSMLSLSQMVSLKVLNKQVLKQQKAALLFGASGLLNVELKDEYPNKLKEEFLFLQSKYSINEKLRYEDWHFTRVRPANFPTLRIAQLVEIVHTEPHLFQLFTAHTSLKELKKSLNVRLGGYWESHIRFDNAPKRTYTKMSSNAIELLLINVTVPLLGAYAKYTDDHSYMQKAMHILSSLKSEKNAILSRWQAVDWNVSSAFDSQGLLELYNSYCCQKACVQCAIGNKLINP